MAQPFFSKARPTARKPYWIGRVACSCLPSFTAIEFEGLMVTPYVDASARRRNATHAR